MSTSNLRNDSGDYWFSTSVGASDVAEAPMCTIANFGAKPHSTLLGWHPILVFEEEKSGSACMRSSLTFSLRMGGIDAVFFGLTRTDVSGSVVELPESSGPDTAANKVPRPSSNGCPRPDRNLSAFELFTAVSKELRVGRHVKQSLHEPHWPRLAFPCLPERSTSTGCRS